jgi:plasmid stabilization system protein ParE
MSHRVVVTQRAERELDEATAWIAQHASETSRRWFWGFVEALHSLQDNPARCGLARENSLVTQKIRQLLYGRRRTYRAIYTVHGDAVVVLAIRHTAQQDLRADELGLSVLD